MSDYKKVQGIYKSRNILLELLKNANYNVSDYEGFNINEINTLIANSQLDMLIEGNNKVYIKYFVDKSNIKPVNIYEIIEDLYNIEKILEKSDNLLIIIKDEPNESLLKLQTSIFEQDNIYIDIINIERLQFNVLNHSIQPNFKVLNEDEIKIIIKKYGIIDNNIPEISRYDPVAQVLLLRPGQYLEIERPSKTSITSKYYRYCINQ